MSAFVLTSTRSGRINDPAMWAVDVAPRQLVIGDGQTLTVPVGECLCVGQRASTTVPCTDPIRRARGQR